MASTGEDVYCTLPAWQVTRSSVPTTTHADWIVGAAVLAQSLRDAGTKKKLAVLVTLDSLLSSTVNELKEIYDHVIPVVRITNPSLENLARLDRLDLRFAFTKIALWRQTQFRKIVYLDADIVALRAPDELFNIESHFAAAPDIGWPDCFNSGVMALTPSISEYWSLHTLASSGNSFDGADQGLLNEYFGQRPWHRLSFTYNCTPSSSYQYEPAYRHFRSSISMVHFIGKDKPWTQGREAISAAGSGVYKELLGKWWATYDRHYRTDDSSAFGQIAQRKRTVQQYVKGEQTDSAFGWDAAGQQPNPPTNTPTTPRPPPEAPAVSTEQPLMDPRDVVDAIDQGHVQPRSTADQRKFSAPQMEWDATRSAPPTESRAEAKNFPSSRYEMSADRGLFKAPTQYPEPPKDMYYQVPETKPSVYQEPAPIFPWEQHKKKASRVFAEDKPSSPPQKSEQVSQSEPQATSSPTASSVPSTSADPWNSFTRTNAWDDDNSINAYVRAFKESQQRQRRGDVQVLHQQEPQHPTASKDFAVSDAESPPVARRRESLILTDFPTSLERPSLPVTPAPITRESFWGEERDEVGKLPTAEGVPEQADWVSKCPRCGYDLSSLLQFRRTSSGSSRSLSAQSVKKPVFVPESVYTIGRASTPPFSSKGLKKHVSTSESVSGLDGTSTPPLSSAASQNEVDSTGNEKTLTRGFSFSKNPHERLEELRRSSFVTAGDQLQRSQQQDLPIRDLPSSSVGDYSSEAQLRAAGAVDNRDTPVMSSPSPIGQAAASSGFVTTTRSASSSGFMTSTRSTMTTSSSSSSEAVRRIQEQSSTNVDSPFSPSSTMAQSTSEQPAEPTPTLTSDEVRRQTVPRLETQDKGGLFDEYSIA